MNDFYFDDFTGDYYLSRDEDGVSRLKVIERVTAVFPDYNQNKGICRQIPFTNQNNVNVTLPKLDRSNLKLTRNGLVEPIYSIEKYDTYYAVCTGDDDYVLGTQVYQLEYEFVRVVTDFSDYQELYWDTNGNGAMQRFNSVTARVHFADDFKEQFDGGKWCYVGAYGQKGSERCEISQTSDGWQFVAKNLDSYENLTFDVEFKPGTFVVPEPEKNYFLVYIMVIVAVVCSLLLIPFIKKYRLAKTKRSFYKGLFVNPEYQPHPNYSIGELTTVYMGKKNDSKIGVLLDMIVKKQIKIIKDTNKPKNWKIAIEKLDAIDEEGQILLKILNNGELPEAGEVIELKKPKASATLAGLGRKYLSGIVSSLKKKQLVTKKFSAMGEQSSATSIMTSLVTVLFFASVLTFMILDEIEDSAPIGVLVGRDYFAPVVLGIVVLTFLIGSLLHKGYHQYNVRTENGLKASRYMDGLKLYIEMAETDRIKMLQSVDGADTSPEGIVHLYEKLLPYAAIFGLEKSWADEMEKYYELSDVEEPEWHQDGISTSDMLLMSSLMNRYVDQSVAYSSGGGIVGGGGSSSGFSGGGGGGFSGGGGGGGGFSGR